MQKNSSSAKPQLAVIVESMHPRVVYALETVLHAFLGIRISIVPEHQVGAIGTFRDAGIPLVGYLKHPSDYELKAFPCNGLLYEDAIRAHDEEIHWYVVGERWLLDEDCIGRIFFCLTQYAGLRPGAEIKLDRHGRYPDGDGALVVHDYLKRISDVLEALVPLAERNAPAFDFEITIDVDQPWKYKHKPLAVRAGGLVKDLLGAQGVGERIGTLVGKPDPFDVLNLVREICPAEKTKVFFLVAGEHPNDSRYDLTMPPYQNLVREWKKAGFEIGIHPSYETYLNPAKTKAEKQLLEGVVGPVHISRQHYLRYQIPATFRTLVDLGIEREYSICQAGNLGAVTGVALPYRWFDLAGNEATNMVMVPAMVMDRTLLQYLQLSPAQATEAIAEWIGKVKAVSGRFVIILHNETFSDSGEWKGWLPVLRNTLQLLQS
jgi:hypothetical protein